VTKSDERTKPALLRFSRDAEMEVWPTIPAAELVTAAPVQRGLTWLDVPGYGLSAGIWDCTAQTSTPFVQSSHEFMLLLEGEVTIVEASGSTTFRAGDALVLPQGLRCQWVQPGYVRKFWMTFEDAALDVTDGSAATGLHAILVDPGAMLTPSPPPPVSVLASAAPVQHAFEAFTDPSGQFSVGVWDTTAYHRTPAPMDRWELMHILEGEASLVDGSGIAVPLSAGDTILAPLAAATAWNGTGYLKKIYCLFTPRREG